MGRKRKGLDISGWVVINKPAGITSTSVVNKVRWAFNANKAGHSGTLDPDATGILGVALGEATKTIPYITDALKAYTFMVRFGQATDTDDASGTVIAQSDMRPDDDQITDALAQFTGDIMQVPPQYSAVHVDGERAYDMARDGETVELAARPLYVDELRLIERPDADHALLMLVCGKGGYVRSIARDLGTALGGHAHVEWLRRDWTGPFEMSDAVTLDQIEEHARAETITQFLHPLEVGLTDLPRLTCPAESLQRFRNGNPAMVFPADVDYGDEAWVEHDGRAIAVGVYKSGELHPSRVFVYPE